MSIVTIVKQHPDSLPNIIVDYAACASLLPGEYHLIIGSSHQVDPYNSSPTQGDPRSRLQKAAWEAAHLLTTMAKQMPLIVGNLDKELWAALGEVQNEDRGIGH